MKRETRSYEKGVEFGKEAELLFKGFMKLAHEKADVAEITRDNTRDAHYSVDFYSVDENGKPDVMFQVCRQHYVRENLDDILLSGGYYPNKKSCEASHWADDTKGSKVYNVLLREDIFPDWLCVYHWNSRELYPSRSYYLDVHKIRERLDDLTINVCLAPKKVWNGQWQQMWGIPVKEIADLDVSFFTMICDYLLDIKMEDELEEEQPVKDFEDGEECGCFG